MIQSSKAGSSGVRKGERDILVFIGNTERDAVSDLREGKSCFFCIGFCATLCPCVVWQHLNVPRENHTGSI